MRKITNFGLCVKTELLRRGETLEGLAEKVKMDTGMFADSAYLSKILSGDRSPPKIITSICKTLELEYPSVN